MLESNRDYEEFNCEFNEVMFELYDHICKETRLGYVFEMCDDDPFIRVFIDMIQILEQNGFLKSTEISRDMICVKPIKVIKNESEFHNLRYDVKEKLIDIQKERTSWATGPFYL